MRKKNIYLTIGIVIVIMLICLVIYITKIMHTDTNLSGSFNASNDKDGVTVIDMDKVEEEKLTPTPVPTETISPTPTTTAKEETPEPTLKPKDETPEQDSESVKIDKKDAVIPTQPTAQTQDISNDKDITGGGEPPKPTNNETQNTQNKGNDKNNINKEINDTKVDDSKLNDGDNTMDEQVVTPTPIPTAQPSPTSAPTQTPTQTPVPTETISPTPKVTEKFTPSLQLTKDDIDRLQSYPWHCGEEPEYNYEELKQHNPNLQDVYNRFLRLKDEKILEKNERFISSIDLIYFTYGGWYIINGIYIKVDDDNNIIEKRDLKILFTQGTWEDKNELVYQAYEFLSE